MEITFSDRKFEKLANDDRKLDREFGKLKADKIRLRLSQLKDAKSLEDLRYVAGNYHQLKENRNTEWSCDLDQPYRLIFTPHERPIPSNDSGQTIWAEIKGIEIIEIINYHKER